ncbi:MAG: MarR family transcriptional regulator [Clostridia bacterium]|nr:MarR family transcriptional regulator [Clostridia bacterium]
MGRIEKEEYIIGSISLLSNKFSQFGDSIHDDITYKQWFLLLMISKMDDGEKNLNSIAEFVGTTRQNVKKIVSQLEDKKYLKVRQSRTDGRALEVELAPKAKKYFENNYEMTSKKTDELFSKIDDSKLDDLVVDLTRLMECFED